MLLLKMSVLEISSLLIVSWKLEELIPSAMVDNGLNNMVHFPLCLQQCLINGFSWYDLSLDHNGQQTSVKWAEAMWNNKAEGIVHLKSSVFFSSSNIHNPGLYNLSIMIFKINIEIFDDIILRALDEVE